MANSGKIKFDDLHQNLQDSWMIANGGGSGFSGIGWNPLGNSTIIEDNDPAIQYSTNDWTRYTSGYAGRAGLNMGYTTATKIGASLTVSFIGTALFGMIGVDRNTAVIGISIDGGSEITLDVGINTANTFDKYVQIASGLSYGFHTVKITIKGLSANGNAATAQFPIQWFEAITQTVGKNLVPPFIQWSDSATVGGTTVVISPYKLNASKTTTGYLTKIVDIPVIAGQQITFSCTVTVSGIGGTIGAGGYHNLYVYDASGGTTLGSYHSSPYATVNGDTTLQNTFIVPTGGVRLRIILGCDSDVTGTFLFSNPMLNVGSTALPFETNGYDKITLATDQIWGKSSAFVGTSRVDALQNVAQQTDEITNLIVNGSTERLKPLWEPVFQDGFTRADGAVGYGWTSGQSPTIVSNAMSLPPSTGVNNGDREWTDRQIKFNYVAPSTGSLYTYIKLSSDWVRVNLLTGTTNNIAFEKNIGGVVTNNLATGSFTITSGTKYYVTCKVQGNIYSVSITTNGDYVTGTTTVYLYNDEVKSGTIYFESGIASTTIDDVEVKAPLSYQWNTFAGGASMGQYYSFGNGYAKMVNPQSLNGSINESYLTVDGFTLLPNTTYTISYDVKASDTNVSHDYYVLNAQTGTNIQTNQSGIPVSTSWQTKTFTFTTTNDLNANGNAMYVRFDNNGKISNLGSGELYIRNLMLVVGSVAPSFHTKESRCDLISLQNDGKVVVTRGNGASELGYRIEAEDGSISKWHRDKRTVQHWDRVKVWKSGTWSVDTNTNNQALQSNGADTFSNTANDTYYISFVGTGIDIKSMTAANEGIANISIDGGTEWSFDCYSPSTIGKNTVASIRNLPYGQHTIKIRVTGTKKSLSSETYVCLDCFDIYVPAIPMNPSLTTMLPVSAVIKADPDYGWIRYEDNEGVFYNGAWTSGNNILTSGNTSSYINQQNATDYLQFSFIGTGIRYISDKNVDHAIAEISIDGGTAKNIDGYSASWQGGVELYTSNTTFGLHTIKIKTTNTRNASNTTGWYVTLDAFDVKNTMYVIDLRKNQSQALIEQKIAEHEAKDLWDAHPQAIKSSVNKQREEHGIYQFANQSYPANAYSTAPITFSKSFTVPPTVFVHLGFGLPSQTWIIYDSENVSTTGFSIVLTLGIAQTFSPNFRWIAIGY